VGDENALALDTQLRQLSLSDNSARSLTLAFTCCCCISVVGYKGFILMSATRVEQAANRIQE
jgi:hypothetical protein